ncbi:hypothetical protein [Jiangella muralis]|uniref:hypothetical protein n=1 Tax=Jiangella muralis TaxID=702383 RepID=UPI00069DD793|nr:hypothetical protein [Jiangella muralis]
MAQWETLYNPGDTPRRRTADGRMIGARSWGTGDVESPVVAAAVAACRLLVVQTLDPVPATGVTRAAAAAMRETHEARHLAAQARERRRSRAKTNTDDTAADGGAGDSEE